MLLFVYGVGAGVVPTVEHAIGAAPLTGQPRFHKRIGNPPRPHAPQLARSS